MVTRVTTSGNYSAVLANLMAAQQRQQAAGNQVATQRNGVNLKDYAKDAELLTAMQSVNTRLSVYQDQNNLLLQKLDTQDTAAKRVAEAAQSVRQILNEALASDRADTFIEDIESQLRNAVDAMNSRFGGKYLFSGGQIDTPPVTVTGLADLAAGPPISSFFQNDQFRVSARVDESTNVNIGILADELGTDLLAAFRTIQTFQTGPNGPFNGPLTAAQKTFIEGQLTTWEGIRANVTTTTARNGVNQKRIESVGEDLQTRLNTLAGMIGKITDADMAQAAANLQQAQLSVQSAAYVFQTLQQSSLINLLR